MNGEVAHLARAFEWHSKGRRFKSALLHLPLLGEDFFIVSSLSFYSLLFAFWMESGFYILFHRQSIRVILSKYLAAQIVALLIVE